MVVKMSELSLPRDLSLTMESSSSKYNQMEAKQSREWVPRSKIEHVHSTDYIKQIQILQGYTPMIWHQHNMRGESEHKM